MRCMDSLIKTVVIKIFNGRFLAELYRDPSGKVPEFGTYQEAGSYIVRHQLPPGSSPVEEIIGERS